MKIRLAVAVAASCVGLGACTTTGGAPATAPELTTSIVTPTEPAATTTADQPVTSTTLDRIAEIEAIFQDLEVRRLQAIMDQDEDAFRSVFANDEYAKRSLSLFKTVSVIDAEQVAFRVVAVIIDEHDCIGVEGSIDATEVTLEGGVGSVKDFIVESTTDGWGFSWVGEGWRCDGPHPFSG